MKNYSNNKTQFLVKHFNNFLDGRIIDVGCNEGIVAKEMELDKIQYLGIDIDLSALKAAKDKGFNTKEVNLSKENLPFEEGEFDSFLCLDILEHIQDPKKIIEKIKKIVKKGGKGIISLPNDLNLTNLLKCLFIGRSIVTRDTLWSPYGYLHLASVKGSIGLIQDNFKIKEIHYLPNSYTVPILPWELKNFLARTFPRFFCGSIIFKVLNTKGEYSRIQKHKKELKK